MFRRFTLLVVGILAMLIGTANGEDPRLAPGKETDQVPAANGSGLPSTESKEATSETLREILQSDCSQTGAGHPPTLGEREWKHAQQISQRLLEGLEVAKRHVHELSHGIMPVQIDAEGLRIALEQLAEATSATGSVRCRFESSGAIAVPDNTAATHMYRIVQEALSNAVRHGRANEIQISVTQNERQISIEIDDNGIGFNSDEPRDDRPIQGMGLRTMKYRAGMIGGVLNIERRAQGGMRVKCTVLGRNPNVPTPITAHN